MSKLRATHEKSTNKPCSQGDSLLLYDFSLDFVNFRIIISLDFGFSLDFGRFYRFFSLDFGRFRNFAQKQNYN